MSTDSRPHGLDPATLGSLPLLLSTARLAPYVTACSGDQAAAIRLYTWNTAAASAFWPELHVLEIVMRNAMHDQLAARFRRDDWWQDPRTQLHRTMQAQLDDAGDKAARTARRDHRGVVAGDVVSALSFGFWSGLTGRGNGLQYETRFWQPAIARAFPGFHGKRSQLNRQLESVRLFRNRIAHHEPIFKRDLTADHASIVRLAGYIDHDATQYIAGLTRVPGVLARRQAFVRDGDQCSF